MRGADFNTDLKRQKALSSKNALHQKGLFKETRNDCFAKEHAGRPKPQGASASRTESVAEKIESGLYNALKKCAVS
jgi:hypothetical protein